MVLRASDVPSEPATPESSDAHKPASGIVIETVLTDGVHGFSEHANACANKAAQFAYHLKHAMIGSDHLMLALTLDENARPLLAALGNVKQLRESAARILGETNAKYLGAPASSDKFDPVLTDDLFEIFATARRAAAGRCQQVAVSDLVNAFPQEHGKLAYGRVETVNPVPAVAERLERRISDFMATFERRLMEDMQRQLTGLVRDFGSALSARLDEIAPIDDVHPREIAPVPNSGFEISGSTPSEGLPTQEKGSEGFWERCGWKR
jgi:Clp amino terminal domain, pathogenicity island component